jgi:hypothetical protein
MDSKHWLLYGRTPLNTSSFMRTYRPFT